MPPKRGMHLVLTDEPMRKYHDRAATGGQLIATAAVLQLGLLNFPNSRAPRLLAFEGRGIHALLSGTAQRQRRGRATLGSRRRRPTAAIFSFADIV